MVTAIDGENTELVIGLVGPIGSSLKSVKKVLEEQLRLTGYEVSQLKISEEIIRELVPTVPASWDGKFQRYKDLIAAGNQARKSADDAEEFDGDPNAVLAYGVAAKIQQGRERSATECGSCNNQPQPKFRNAYIVDSLKRPEEVEWLRKIYPDGFILIGVFESEEDRRKNLCGLANADMTDQQATELFDDDENEESEPHGQRLVKTFHLADFFLHLKNESEERLHCDITRFVELWFGHPHTTPTFDEYAMYMAFAASLRTADLSRQVGAVVAMQKEILSTGSNECPRPGGGLYWPVRTTECIADEDDGRDYVRGHDSNKKAVSAIVDEVMSIINGVVELAKTNGDVNEEHLRKRLEKSTIGDLTEFGRVVHAEMEAILACARNNVSTRGATLFCTTFPCHNCAKHIIAAGIQRVVYIEPYAKSRAFEHHTDAIVRADPSQVRQEGDQKVFFEPFVGVGPRRYLDLFSMKQGAGYNLVRKTGDGDTIDWDVSKSRLRLQMNPTSYLDSEDEASQLFRTMVVHTTEGDDESGSE